VSSENCHTWRAIGEGDPRDWTYAIDGGAPVEVCTTCGARCRRDRTGAIELYSRPAPGVDKE
jgi:hypothetical protein